MQLEEKNSQSFLFKDVHLRFSLLFCRLQISSNHYAGVAMSSKYIISLCTFASFIASPLAAASKVEQKTEEQKPPFICSAKQMSKCFTTVAKKSMPAVVFIKIQSSADEQQNPFQSGERAGLFPFS